MAGLILLADVFLAYLFQSIAEVIFAEDEIFCIFRPRSANGVKHLFAEEYLVVQLFDQKLARTSVRLTHFSQVHLMVAKLVV